MVDYKFTKFTDILIMKLNEHKLYKIPLMTLVVMIWLYINKFALFDILIFSCPFRLFLWIYFYYGSMMAWIRYSIFLMAISFCYKEFGRQQPWRLYPGVHALTPSTGNIFICTFAYFFDSMCVLCSCKTINLIWFDLK